MTDSDTGHPITALSSKSGYCPCPSPRTSLGKGDRSLDSKIMFFLLQGALRVWGNWIEDYWLVWGSMLSKWHQDSASSEEGQA